MTDASRRSQASTKRSARGNEAPALLNIRNGGGASALPPERWECSSSGSVMGASASVDMRSRWGFHCGDLSVCCYVRAARAPPKSWERGASGSCAGCLQRAGSHPLN